MKLSKFGFEEKNEEPFRSRLENSGLNELTDRRTPLSIDESLKELGDDPTKVIRLDRYHKEYLQEDIKRHEFFRRSLEELRDTYGQGLIDFPRFSNVVGKTKNKEGRQREYVMTVTDKVEGDQLLELDPQSIKNDSEREGVRQKIEKLYCAITRYYMDKLNDQATFVGDLEKPQQWVLGKDGKIYLVDMDPIIRNFREQKQRAVEDIAMVFYWMEGMERKWGGEFTEARKLLHEGMTRYGVDGFLEDYALRDLKFRFRDRNEYFTFFDKFKNFLKG